MRRPHWSLSHRGASLSLKWATSRTATSPDHRRRRIFDGIAACTVTLDTPLGRDLTFRSMGGFEALSRPFVYELDVLSTRSDIKAAGLLGQPVTMHLDLSGGGTTRVVFLLKRRCSSVKRGLLLMERLVHWAMFSFLCGPPLFFRRSVFPILQASLLDGKSLLLFGAKRSEPRCLHLL
jgi:hypothetical protein